MQQTKSFAGIYFLSCASSLAVAIGINVLGNETNLFPFSVFPAATDRAWKTRRLDEAAADRRLPKVIILGSSRAWQIQPKYVEAITGKRAFNYAVRRASPTDYLTQLRYLLSIGCKPELIILGIDEHAFQDQGFALDELFSHSGLFREVRFPKNVQILSSVMRSCDIETTYTSLGRLLRRISLVDRTLEALGRPRKSRTIENAEGIMLDDGYLIYYYYMRAKVRGSFNLEAQVEKDVREGRKEIRTGILKPEAASQKDFEEFLSLARANRIEVRAMVMPYHPDFERKVFDEEVREARRRLRQYLGKTCAFFGASFTDLSDLHSYEGDPQEFYDAVHLTPVNTQRMINVLFGLPARTAVADVPTDWEIIGNPPLITSVTKD